MAAGRPCLMSADAAHLFSAAGFVLSDPAAEEALYDSAAMRGCVGIGLGNEATPDETTICKFRHLLECHRWGKKPLTVVNEYLPKNGLRATNGTIVDATIMSAPRSTKNQDGKRDPDMHQLAQPGRALQRSREALQRAQRTASPQATPELLSLVEGARKCCKTRKFSSSDVATR